MDPATSDTEDRLFEILTGAIGFSPWGATMVWIAWSARRDVVAGLKQLALLWRETLDIVKPWSDRTHELSEAIRESAVTETKARRPRTNPVNLPSSKTRQ